MKTFIKTIALFLSFLVFTSCAIDTINRVKGNRNVKQENREITNNFSKIKVSNGLDVFIYQGENPKLTVEADENLQDIIKTEIKNGVLKVFTEKNIWKEKAKKVHITVNKLDAVVASSGSDVSMEDFFTSKNFDVKSSSGADITVRIKSKNFTGSSSSGADLVCIGKSENAILSSSSGSDLDAFKLQVKNVTAKASSGSNIDTYATESITANASSGGDIDFKGNPKKVIKKSSSGGSVSKK